VSGRALALGALLLCRVALADLAVSRDGSVVRAPEILLDEKEGLWRAGKRVEPLAAWLLVEKGDGRCVWARDAVSRKMAYAYLAQEMRREMAIALLKEALAAQDAEGARGLFERAQRDGFFGRKADSAEAQVRTLEARSRRAPDAKVAALRQKAKEIDELHASLLTERAIAERAHGGDGLGLLREALLLSPKHEAALEALAGAAPASFALGDRRLWLDWRLDVEAGGAALAAAGNPGLAAARRTWRDDLFGVETGPILLLTPVRDTSVLGRCLACGRLTTRLLAELFAGYPVLRMQAGPMVVYLFADKEEYLQCSGGILGSEVRADLEWTAGHYSPSEHVSRFFWHKERDAERRIVGTFVHELTHHWLEEQNPAQNPARMRATPMTPGYWIVEGFATLLEEGRYDIERGTWSLFAPRSRSLDVVASIGAGDLVVPWPAFYRLHQMAAQGLPPDSERTFSRRWALGRQPCSPRRIFYEQAGATCHFLYHAEGGKYRKALLDYVIAQNAGDADRLSIEAAFGMSGADLGQRVVEFAQAVAKGWRPP